jgi:hypothetical protein
MTYQEFCEALHPYHVLWTFCSAGHAECGLNTALEGRVFNDHAPFCVLRNDARWFGIPVPTVTAVVNLHTITQEQVDMIIAAHVVLEMRRVSP